MTEKSRGNRPDRDIPDGPCGQKTTVFFTAARRQLTRRSASPRRRRSVWSLVACVTSSAFAAGCSALVTATPLHPPPRPLVPRAPGSVQVLAGAKPSEPHVDVALLQVPQYHARGEGLAELIRHLRERAAEIGCDALYIQRTTERDGAAVLLDPDAQLLLASCVVFTPPAAPREDAEMADSIRR